MNEIKRSESTIERVNRTCTIGRKVRLIFLPVFGKQSRTDGIVIENDPENPFIILDSGTFRKDRVESVSFLGNGR